MSDDTTGNSRLNTGIFELDQSTSDFYQDNFSNSNFMAASPISEPTDQDMIDPHRMHIPLDMVVWDGSETPGTEAADTHLKSWGAPGDGLSKNLRPQGATFENVMAIPQLLNGPSTQLPSNDPSSMNVDDFIQSANESTAAAGQLRKANTAHSERTSSLHDDQTGDFQLYPNGLTVGDNSLFIQPPCVYQGSYNRRERPSIPKDGLRNSDDTRERNLHPTGSFAAGSQVSCPDSHDEPLSNRSVRLPPHSIPPPMHQTFEVPLPTEQIPLPGMLCRYQPTTTHVTQDDMLVQDDNHYFEEPSKSRYGRELRGSISPTVTSRNEAESSNADRLLLMYLAPSHPESCPDSPHSASIV